MNELIGFRTRNAQTGMVEVEVSTRLSRILGELTISGSGFFAVPEFDQDYGWVMYPDLTYVPYTQMPVARVRKSTPGAPAGIWWQLEGNWNIPARSTTIIYGVG